jgi:isoleucyl-tRNA synthetase
VTESYDNFAFHKVFSILYNFCTVEMSSIYMDVLKDRLYCDETDSKARRSSQSVMLKILDSMVRMLAPILAHTAEEAWAAMKFKSENADTVHLASMPKVDDSIDYKASEGKWKNIMSLRDDVLRELEQLRKNQEIASNQEATVTVATNDEKLVSLLEGFGLENFATLCIISEFKLEKCDCETQVKVNKSNHNKCDRCWNFWPSVGTDSEHPKLCQRCADVIKKT